MVRFDDAIDVAISTVREALGASGAETTVVRDAAGVLTVVLPDDAQPSAGWDALAAKLDKGLERFSPGDARVLLRTSDLIAPEDVLQSPDRIRFGEEGNVWLIDRLLTNQDWLREPICREPALPTATAYSIKGGVGRSTALAVLAWHLARSGRSVLVADLDLEAPGIGAMLLREMPDYGVVDWCVESLSGQADADLLQQSIADSPVAQGEEGSVRVIPAVGRRTRDYVAKLGRAYLPVLDARSGRTKGLADRLHDLIGAAAQLLEPPDVILLDARAGLHDIGSAAVTQLGAEVFLFARDDSQTWEAYRRLFEHLRLAKSVAWGMPEQDLRWKLKMVAAQLDPRAAALASWVDRSYGAWAGFYDAEAEGEASAESFERDEESAPHYPLPINFDQRVQGVNFVDATARPDWGFLELAFKSFLDGASERLASRASDGGAAP